MNASRGSVLMPVSPGDLDSLLGVSFLAADLTASVIDSFTTITTPGILGIASMTVTPTGSPAFGTTAGNSLSVISVDDQLNTITFDVTNGGMVSQQTDWVLGFNQNDILLSNGGEGLTQVYLQLISGDSASIDAGVLGDTPVTPGTPLTFTVAGTSDVTPATLPPLVVKDAGNGQSLVAAPAPYTGPVAGITQEYINISPENLIIFATTPGWFIATGSGLNAITVGSGTNILDGGTGSAFMTAGSGSNTFFLDDRAPAADIWDTVNNFHIGDTMTLWGVTAADFKISWIGQAGAQGFTGLTLTVTEAGHPNASVTFGNNAAIGVSLTNMAVTYGVENASGLAYMNVRAISV